MSINQLFLQHNLRITTVVNIKIADFLDIPFNLETDSFKPFIKDSCLPFYIPKL